MVGSFKELDIPKKFEEKVTGEGKKRTQQI